MKKKLLSLFAVFAVMLSLSACQAEDTEQNIQTSEAVESVGTVFETLQAAETTSPENTEVIYETLAEEQERDWKIEDVLKNDLEIDGIPISIPCTVEELLDTLGEEYSIDGNDMLCYDNKTTILSMFVNDTYSEKRIVEGFHSTYYMIEEELLAKEKGILKFPVQHKYSNLINKYTFPNEIILDNNKTNIRYLDEFGYLTFSFRENNLTSVFIGKKSGGIDNE